MVDDNINLSVCAPEVGMLQLELLSLVRSLSSVTKYSKPYKQKRKMYSGRSTEKKRLFNASIVLSCMHRSYFPGCRLKRCLSRHISLSLSLVPSFCFSWYSAEETWGRGKGQGPGEEVVPQEHTQLKLGLRLAFTVKIVNLSSPHRPLRKHMLYLSALGSF